jgi:hypothetical protein
LLDKGITESKYGWKEGDNDDLRNVKLVIAADVIYDDDLTDALFSALRYSSHHHAPLPSPSFLALFPRPLLYIVLLFIKPNSFNFGKQRVASR